MYTYYFRCFFMLICDSWSWVLRNFCLNSSCSSSMAFIASRISSLKKSSLHIYIHINIAGRQVSCAGHTNPTYIVYQPSFARCARAARARVAN